MKKSIGKYNKEDLFIIISSYRNGRIYVGLETKETLYADITINLSNFDIEDDNYIFMSNHIDSKLQNFLIEKEIIEEPFNIVNYNFEKYKCTKINFLKLKEYSTLEFENYINKKDIYDDIYL